MRSRLPLGALVAFLFAVVAVPAAHAASCDPIDPRACLLPWPNDYFTKVDKSTPTGLRLNLTTGNLPKNAKGQPAVLSAFNGNDGFSPGAQIMTQVPGLDLKRTGAVPITNVGAYADKNQPVVVIDAKTGKRWPVWAETNSRAEKAKDASLDVHPAKNWLEGHRYIVALRNLKNASGQTIKPGKAFKAFLDGKAKGARAAHIANLLKTLKKAGVKPGALYLAWDFTVASETNLSSRFLTMRNDAFKQLGDTDLKDGVIPATSKSPTYTIDKVTDLTAAEDPQIARKIEGTLDVPCYLDQKGCPSGASMHYTSKTSWKPSQLPGNVMKAKFFCNIPRVAFDQPGTARPSLYGHGLLGSATEINQGQLEAMSQDHDMVFCATPEIGMSSEDVPNAIKILGNFSTFNTFPDRLQQGMLDGLYLGRAMIHPKGLTTDPAFRTASGQPVFDTSHLYYDGNSQGGIFGGALTAVAPDFTRAVLGVVGMNYSLLVWRSTDFSSYLNAAFKPAYPDALDQELILNVAQSLWDRGEGDGYAQHMTTDPLPGTPKHTVLMHVALGDHQVSQWAAEVEARTIGAAGYKPGGQPYDPGRGEEKVPMWGIPALKIGTTGSGLVVWDSGPVTTTGSNDTQNLRVFGTDVSLIGNLPAVSAQDGEISDGSSGQPPAGTYIPGVVGNGRDPHELPRNTPAARQQKSDFLKPNGTITDQCNNAPCHSVKDY